MSTFSPSLRIELITTGDQAGVWGNTTNTNLGTLIESAIAGYVSVSITSADQALTALNGAADESRNMSIALTTTTSAAFNVYAPPAEKTYIIYNASAYAATIFNSTVLGNTTAAGTGVVIPAGKTVPVWSDGTNFAAQISHLPTLSLTTDLAVADGGTGASTAVDARTNLGLGTSATQNANAVSITGGAIAGVSITGASITGASITGGSITGITDLAIADGGTGASTAADARTNLDVPSRAGGGATGTWGISVSGNAATATSPASGGSFITSSNILSQSVNFATNATNSTFASNPASGGTFITTNNIANQSVNFASTAGNGGVTSVNGATGAVTVQTLGVGQSWQTPSRSLGTTYTNSTGRPIQVNASVYAQGSNLARAFVNGLLIIDSRTVDCCGVPQISYFPLSFTVPDGATYQITGSAFTVWAELR